MEPGGPQQPQYGDEEKAERYRMAAAKFQNVGRLGITAEDHRAIGSTPPDELTAHPRKTLADIMSEQEIAAFLEGDRSAIKNMIALHRDTGDRYLQESIARNIIKGKNELSTTISYLQSIHKLPPEFESYSVEDDQELVFEE